MMIAPLMLKAPPRFKLSKSIKLPTIAQAARELDYWHDKQRENARGYAAAKARGDRYWSPLWHDDRTVARKIAEAKMLCDCAEWIADYIAQHDCKPKILDQRGKIGDYERWARVQVENDIYRVTICMGRRARGMYGQNGCKWHLSVARQGTDRRLIDGDYCAKSEGYTGNAVREHLFRLWRLERGMRSKKS